MVAFRSFADLDNALDQAVAEPPAFLFMAAAVSDYSPAPAEGKLSSKQDELTITLTRNPKLLGTLRERCGSDTYLVGFKLLSSVSPEHLIEVAKQQVVTNDLDLCLGNDLSEFEADQHPAWLVAREGRAIRVEGTKAEVAEHLVRTALQRGLRTVPLSDLTQVVGDAVHGRDTGDPLFQRIFAHHPSLRALAVLPRGLVVPSVSHTVEPDHGASAEAALTTALAREAWAGRWRGGGFSVRVQGGGAWVTFTEAGLWGLAERWSRTVAAWRTALQREGLDPDAAEPQPVWHGSRLIGLSVQIESAVGPSVGLWLRPEARRKGRGDQLLEHLSVTGHRIWTHPRLATPAWFAERGWVPVHEAPDAVVLDPPSARRDLRPAASVCLLDPLRRRVLLGQRKTPPLLGHWAFPGGSREGEESTLQNALRELAEETGITLGDVEPMLETHVVVGGTSGHYIVNFVVPVLDAATPVPTDEFDARWVELDDVHELGLVTAGTRRILRRLRRVIPTHPD